MFCESENDADVERFLSFCCYLSKIKNINLYASFSITMPAKEAPKQAEKVCPVTKKTGSECPMAKKTEEAKKSSK